MKKIGCIFVGLLLAVLCAGAGEPTSVQFQKQTITAKFYSEGANTGDFNKDGIPDIVSGPFWYQGPDFKKSHAFFEPKDFDGSKEWSNAFFAFVDDFNHDGWDDVLIIGFPGEDASWFENPKGGDGLWKRHLILQPVDDESPTYSALIGDGHARQLVCIHDQQFGYATPDPSDPTKEWTFHPISPKAKNYYKYTHGLGVGDINGDGRADLIEKDGWWEQPPDLAGDPVWKHHPFTFAVKGAQMFAYDVNGDGKADVITSIDAHGYGLAWYEQTTKDGEISFIKHLILGEKPEDTPNNFSQLHGVDLADINGDGLLDIVTGKRHWAHNDEGDPDPNGASVLYWFELKRGPGQTAEFIPHLIDDQSGVGTQVLVADVDGDHKPDIVVGNKSGTFVFTQKAGPTTGESTTNKSTSAAAVVPAPAVAPTAAPMVDHFKEYIRTTPALSPEEERKSFHLPPGFDVQLVASEPQIAKPINLAFDAKGCLWLSETREYPIPRPKGSDGKDDVKVIDLSPDGHASRFTTFADKLDIPMGIYPSLSSPIIYDIPTIKRYYDDNHDGQADRSELLYGTFGYDRDTHGMTNSFRRGFDGWLYACHGYDNTSIVTGTDGQAITLVSGNTYRMRLDGSHVEFFTHGQTNPFGLTWDAMGNLYSSDSTSKPFYQLLRGGYYEGLSQSHDGLGFAPVMMTHHHGSTAIAGACCYAADLFPAEFQNNMFCGNVVTSRINRDSVTFIGSTPKAHEEKDFLISDDPWFRPCDIRLGPDGALYVADFYNRIIGHDEVALDHPGRDHFHGRIWRISYKEKDAGASNVDMTTQSLDGLIGLLASPNLCVRMLATDEITDRVGKPATSALVDLFHGDKATAFQRVHAMWALYRLGSLNDAVLAERCHDQDAIVRVHAMRVLADMQDWNPRREELATGGLADPDALVRRCAADALGAHPNLIHVRPLLEMRKSTDAADTHLIYVTRMAIRDCLKTDGALAHVGPLSSAELQMVANLTLSIRTPAAADFLLDHLDQLSGSGEQLSRYTHHAVRYVSRERVDDLMTAFQKRFSSDVDEQLEILNAVASGAAERGEAVTPACRKWAMELAEQALTKSGPLANSGWTFAPFEGATAGANPWAIQMIPSSDGTASSPFLSSLPFGESLTGYLRSSSFAIPPELRFFIAGHNGPRSKKSTGKNLIHLRSAATKEILAEALAPRNDVAQPVAWDLRKYSGQQGYLELVDGDDAKAYAWLAAGRFQPDVVPLPAPTTVVTESGRIAACELAGSLRLAEVRPQIVQRLRNRSASSAERTAAGAALVGIDPDASLDDLIPVLTDPSENPDLRMALSDCLPAIKSAPQINTVIASIPAGTREYQKAVAMALAKSPEATAALLDAMPKDKAPRALLQDRDVELKVLASGLPNAEQRIKELTRGLPSVTIEIDKLISARRKAFLLSPGSPDRGQRIFAANCIVCHTINGSGGHVGPLLDGIGNRGSDRLIEDLLDPSRNVEPAFRYSNVYLKDGDIVTGIQRREEGDTLVFVNSTGKEVSVPKEKIVKSVPSTLSLMPSGFGEVIKPNDFNDLVSFLLSSSQKK